MINLYNIDCMDFMADKPDRFYDLAIVDPPYGLGISSHAKMSGNSTVNYTIKNWDDVCPTIEYFNELRRISKNQIIWGSNFFDGVGLCGGGIVWNKLGIHTERRKPLPGLSDCEIAYCSMRNNVKMFSYTQIGNVYGNNYSINFKQKRIHPTQKPVELYEWLLMNYAKQGDKILDTHGGSGSICIACHNLGFDLDWCELDTEYFESAKKRYEIHISQQRLF